MSLHPGKLCDLHFLLRKTSFSICERFFNAAFLVLYACSICCSYSFDFADFKPRPEWRYGNFNDLENGCKKKVLSGNTERTIIKVRRYSSTSCIVAPEMSKPLPIRLNSLPTYCLISSAVIDVRGTQPSILPFLPSMNDVIT